MTADTTTTDGLRRRGGAKQGDEQGEKAANGLDAADAGTKQGEKAANGVDAADAGAKQGVKAANGLKAADAGAKQGEKAANGLKAAEAGAKQVGKAASGSEKALLVEQHEELESNLQGEWFNLAILMVLYFLQGLPMGLSAVLPMILKERGASFSDVGTFSLNSWPFSLKLLWAPIVDTVYFAGMGRRKSWLVPTQLAIGAILLSMPAFMDDLLFTEKPAILPLTAIFFVLYFLCATQDIAVDGWALTMLRPENVGWAATCNAFGQTAGYAFGLSGFTVLESLKVVTLPSFMAYTGVAFLVVTVVVCVCKAEAPVPEHEEPEGLAESYRQMGGMLKLKPFRKLIFCLLTWKVAFSVTDNVAPLKLQDYGIPKAHLTYISSLLMPFYLVLPLIATKWTAGKRPMDFAVAVYPLRVLIVPLTAAVAYFTPAVLQPLPYGFYAVVMLVSFAGATAAEFIFVAQMAFFSRISDPAMGGTYMTLLNTISNLGSMWPKTVVFYLVDFVSCQEESCPVKVDGFYVVVALSTLIGVAWYFLCSSTVTLLQGQPLDDWRVRAAT